MMTVIPVVIDALETDPKGLVKGIWKLGNKTGEDHPIYSIIKIGENIEKSRGDLWRLVITQTSVEDHQLTLV